MKRHTYQLLSALTLLAILICLGEAYAGTCTSISRTNNSANSVLTSTKYNSDLNTVYTQINALDAGCLTDGTLELAAVNASEWAVVLNAIREGCEVTRSDANTLSVDKCAISVNGSFVKTTSSNTATWGCTDCSAQANDTTYYLYAKNGSASASLSLLISTTAPNGDSYDSSGNRVLARFYNDTSGDIDQYSITQWRTGAFENKITDWIAYTPSVFSDSTAPVKGTTTTDQAYFRRSGDNMEVRYKYFAGTAGTNGTGTHNYIGFPNSIQMDTSKISVSTSVTPNSRGIGGGIITNASNCDLTSISSFEMYPIPYIASGMAFQFLQNSGGNSFTPWGPASTSHNFDDANTCFHVWFSIPVKGW